MDRLGLELPEQINHGSLMQCMIAHLMDNKRREEREEFERLEQQQAAKRAALLEAKAKRKAAAIQRSLERQAQGQLQAASSNN